MTDPLKEIWTEGNQPFKPTAEYFSGLFDEIDRAEKKTEEAKVKYFIEGLKNLKNSEDLTKSVKEKGLPSICYCHPNQYQIINEVFKGFGIITIESGKLEQFSLTFFFAKK